MTMYLAVMANDGRTLACEVVKSGVVVRTNVGLERSFTFYPWHRISEVRAILTEDDLFTDFIEWMNN